MKNKQKIKVALYLDNKNISDIDLSSPELGNPGIGGTQYNFISMPYYFQKYYQDVEFIYFCYKTSTLPNIFESHLANNCVEAYLGAEKLKCDLFIWRPTEQEDSRKLLEISDSHSLNIIAWVHSSLQKHLDIMLSKANRVKQYVTVSKTQYDEIDNYFLLTKSSFIFNGFDTTAYKHKQTHEKDPYMVVFTGSLVPAKGFGLLAKVWKRVLEIEPKAMLYVIGSGQLYDRNTALGKWGVADESFESSEIRPYLSDEHGEIHSSVKFLGTVGTEKITLGDQNHECGRDRIDICGR